MAKQDWAGISDAKAAVRLGKLLGVAFEAEPLEDLGGTVGAMANVADDAWVALQLERKHNHPVENVVQYWRWLERSRRRLVLVHAIAPDARGRTGPRSDLTTWIGTVMQHGLSGRFAYCRLELGSPDEAEQVEAARKAIATLRRPLEGKGFIAGT